MNFDEFRTVVRAGRNKSLLFEYEPGRFGLDRCLMRAFDLERPTELPRLFVGCRKKWSEPTA